MERADIRNVEKYIEIYFPIAKASSLSLEDKFLKHKPKTLRQSVFKERLVEAIKSGLSDFRAQIMDPSFDERIGIFYKEGSEPAVEKSPNWWKYMAENFMPQKGSRIGEPRERVAFLALRMKYLIEKKGYTVSKAWEAVCDKSRDLGHFLDSENAKIELEPTGCRPVGDWYDLGNTCKITFEPKSSEFWTEGGYCMVYSDIYALADIELMDRPEELCHHSTAWIVMSV